MIRRLQPQHANVQKRLTKSPKVYVRDTGLLHFLAGLRQRRDLETWPRRGHSFESMVLEELVALAGRRLVRPEITFWRTQAGAEVDLLIGGGRRMIPIEIKLGHAITGRDVRGLRECMKDLSLSRGYVVTSGPERRLLGRDVEIIPWKSIAQREFDFGLGA